MKPSFISSPSAHTQNMYSVGYVNLKISLKAIFWKVRGFPSCRACRCAIELNEGLGTSCLTLRIMLAKIQGALGSGVWLIKAGV